MAGFMSGFGSAFSRSFENARERSAQREDDLFKIKFQQYAANKKKYDDLKAEDAKAVRLAKSLTEANGQPSESWSKVYDWVKSGMSEEMINKQLQNGKFEISAGEAPDPQTADTPDATQSPANLSEAAGASVDAQMQQSGMTPPKDGGLFGGTQNASGMDLRSNRNERVDNRISEVTGDSAGDIQKMMDSGGNYTPEPLAGEEGMTVTWKPSKGDDAWDVKSIEAAKTNLVKAEESGDPAQIARAQRILDAQIGAVSIQAEAMARAKGEFYEPKGAAIIKNGEFAGYAIPRKNAQGEQKWVDPKTNQILGNDDVVPYTKEMSKDMAEIAEKTQKPAEEYINKAENLASIVLLSKEMQDIATNNPKAAGFAGQAASYLDAAARNISGTIALFANRSAETGEYTTEVLGQIREKEKALEDKLRNFTGDEIQRTALDAALLDAKATRMAYAYGVSQGQEGRSVAVSEFENFKRNALANGNPVAMKQSTAEFVSGEYNKLKIMEENLNNSNSLMRRFELTYSFPSPFKPAADVDTLLGSNPDVKSTLDEYKGMAVGSEPVRPAGGEEEGQPKFLGKLKDGRSVYEDPDGVRRIR